MALGVCLNPYSKLDLFEDWDRVEHDGTPPANAESYSQKYREMFIQYYNENYRPRLEIGPEEDLTINITPARSSGFGRRSKPLPSRPCQPTKQNESIEYLNSPPEIDYEEKKNSGDIFYEPDILKFWKDNAGRFPNLSRMARDILAVQGGSVGVERMFSMGRDVIPYRRNRLEKKSIRATMIVKSYLQKELRKVAEGLDPEAERVRLQNCLALSDYESAISTDSSPGGYISDDDERGKMDTSWDFVEHDGEKAFRRERAPPLPPRKEKPGKGLSELVGEEDIHLGLDESELFGEEDEEEDEYGNFDYGDIESGRFSSTGEDHDVENEGGAGEDSETDVDDDIQEKENSINNHNKSQGSRKRAGSNLAQDVEKRSWKRK